MALIHTLPTTVCEKVLMRIRGAPATCSWHLRHAGCIATCANTRSGTHTHTRSGLLSSVVLIVQFIRAFIGVLCAEVGGGGWRCFHVGNLRNDINTIQMPRMTRLRLHNGAHIRAHISQVQPVNVGLQITQNTHVSSCGAKKRFGNITGRRYPLYYHAMHMEIYLTGGCVCTRARSAARSSEIPRREFRQSEIVISNNINMRGGA